MFLQKFRIAWKSVYRLLFGCVIDPVSLNSIGQVVFEYWAFKVIKSMKFISQIILQLSHIETCSTQ